MRRAARIDANHAEVAAAFRQLGCTVLSLAAVGDGCPDLLIGKGGTSGFGGKSALIEVKDGTKPPSKRMLTPDQTEFHKAWRGPIFIVDSLEQIPHVVRAL